MWFWGHPTKYIKWMCFFIILTNFNLCFFNFLWYTLKCINIFFSLLIIQCSTVNYEIMNQLWCTVWRRINDYYYYYYYYYYLKKKAKQHLYKFTVFLIISTIIHKNTPIPSWKKAQCRKTKWKRKICQYFKEDAVLCRSISTYL